MEPIVTLTTDWGDHDFFLGAVKGALYSSIPQVRIVDLSHSQEWNDSFSVANMVRHACLSFPVGTIHLVDVGSNDDKSKSLYPVATCYRGHYLICGDVATLEFSLDADHDTVYSLSVPQASSAPSCTFMALTIMCPAVARLVQGATLDQLGSPLADFRPKSRFAGLVDNNTLQAMVTTVDKYGNAQLNVTYEEFCQLLGDRKFRVEFNGYRATIDGVDAVTSVSRHYSDVHRGALLLTVSSTGYLQLAINKGSARQLIGLKPTTTCLFRFL